MGQVGTMANTTAAYSRIDSNLKNEAEAILDQLGISPSSALSMFYRQVILHNGLPFEVRLPAKPPLGIGSLTRGQLDVELAQGVASVQAGSVITADEVDDLLKVELGI